MTDHTTFQWLLMAVGACLIGLAKAGLPGLGILAIPLFASVVPAKESTGLILPILVIGDIIGVALFRQHAQWKFLWKLFPWTMAGVLVGWQALGWLDNAQIRPLIGGIVLIMLALNLWRQRRKRPANPVPRFSAGPGFFRDIRFATASSFPEGVLPGYDWCGA